jgi:hypothetical protein
MGLNLCIRRIIFTTVEKYDGQKTRRLLSSVSSELEIANNQLVTLPGVFLEQELKQIAGRAGRYNVFNGKHDSVGRDESANDSTEPVIIPGEVLGMSKSDVAHIESCLKAADITVKQAGLCPTIELLKLLCIVALKNKHAPIVRGFFDEHERDQWSHAYDNKRPQDSIYASTVAHVHTRTVAGSISVDTDIDVIVENDELGAALESKRSMLSRLKLGKQYRYERVLSPDLCLCVQIILSVNLARYQIFSTSLTSMHGPLEMRKVWWHL